MTGAVVVVDNRTDGDAGSARHTWARRGVPAQAALRTCHLMSGHLSPARPAPRATSRSAQGGGGKHEDGSLPPPAPAPTPSCPTGTTGWGRGRRLPVAPSLSWSARTGERIRPGRQVLCKGLPAFQRKPCGRGGALEHLRGPWKPGTVCNVWTTTQSSSTVQEKRHLSEEAFGGGAPATHPGPAGGGRAPPAGRRQEGGSRAGFSGRWEAEGR